MNAAHWAFVGRRVWHSVREMPLSHALISVMTAMTLFIFSMFLLLQQNLESILKGWGEQLQINVYLEKDIAVERIQTMLSRIRDLPEVQRVRYISQEQAWREFEHTLAAHPGVLEGLSEDVLPPSFEIVVRPELRDGATVKAFAERLQDETGVAAVEYAGEWVTRLNLLVVALRWAKWLMGGVLLAATFFIVDSAIKLALAARRDEVEIMQLVGASDALISAPFVLEGMIRGVIGAALAIVCLWASFRVVEQEISGIVTALGGSAGVRFLAPDALAAIVAIGWFLGAAGSLFSLRRFLHTWND